MSHSDRPSHLARVSRFCRGVDRGLLILREFEMSLAALVLVALAQLPASPDPKPVPVSGIVVDGSGQPAANADVWLAEALSLDEAHRFGMELWWSTLTQPHEGSTPVLVHARTDAAGRFTIDIPAEVVARRSPVPMVIWAADTGKGARVAWHRLPRIALADDPPVRIELGPAARAEIAVLGPDRNPIAGARVIPFCADEIPVPEPLGQALAATSEASGRATIPGLSPAALAAVRVEAPGFGMQIIQMPVPESGIPESGITRSHGGGIAVTLAPVFGLGPSAPVAVPRKRQDHRRVRFRPPRRNHPSGEDAPSRRPIGSPRRAHLVSFPMTDSGFQNWVLPISVIWNP